jgi:hypothetical protein
LSNIRIPKRATAQARANAVTAKTEHKAKNEEMQETINTLLEQQDGAICYKMMNVRDHIIHHNSAMTDPHLMWKELETLFAAASEYCPNSYAASC